MLEYKGYCAFVGFNAKANIYYGEVVNIRDVVTFQGETIEELQQAFTDSIEDYLAFCVERGEEPDQPFLEQVPLQPPQEECQSERYKRELEIINRHAEELNAEAMDALIYQIELFDDEEDEDSGEE